jgi:hypothetical protein
MPVVPARKRLEQENCLIPGVQDQPATQEGSQIIKYTNKGQILKVYYAKNPLPRDVTQCSMLA